MLLLVTTLICTLPLLIRSNVTVDDDDYGTVLRTPTKGKRTDAFPPSWHVVSVLLARHGSLACYQPLRQRYCLKITMICLLFRACGGSEERRPYRHSPGTHHRCPSYNRLNGAIYSWRDGMAWQDDGSAMQCNAMRTWQQLLMRAQFLDWGPATDGTGMKLDRVVACPANANACSGGRRGSGNSARIRRVRYHDRGSSTATLSLPVWTCWVVKVK